ncbi:MAG: GLUG motif-containing protein [Ignavibacteriaceae bacterium]
MKKYSLFLIILLLAAMTITSNATTYYSVSDNDANNLNTWWTNRNGTGTHPANFTMAEDIFTIQYDITTSISSDWTVAGTIIIEGNGHLSAPNQPYNLAINTLTVEPYGQFICGSSLVVSGATYSDGDIQLKGTSRNYTFADITLNTGHFWDQSAGTSTVTINGDFINNLSDNINSFDASKSQYKFSGSGKTLSGTSSIPRAEFTGNYTNNGTLTCATELTVTGASVSLTNNGTITASTALSGTGWVIQGSSGVLNIAGTSGITYLNASANPGNTVNYTGAAQTGKVTRYSNLTLSGSGEKIFATTPEISGILSLEGTASVVVTTGVVTYGSEATLQYNKSGSYTATTEEWITPFEARGGIIINNTGAITPPASSTIGSGSMLTIKSGASIITNSPTYSPGAKLKYEGNVQQTTTTVELPTSMACEVIINNSGGVILGNTTTIHGMLTFMAGNLLPGSNNLTLGSGSSGATAGACVVTNSTGIVKKFIENSSGFTFPVGPTTTKYNPVTIQNNNPAGSGGDGADFTVLVKTISPVAPIPSNSLNYMWTITGPVSSNNLSFTWSNDDAGSGLAADPLCGIAYLYTTEWTQVGGNTTQGTPNITNGITSSALSGNWTIGGNFSAYSGSGTGLSGDPYLVATMENLAWISQNSTVWGRYFKQTAIIDAASTSDGGSGWLPIGNNTKKFRGTYDGQGYTISGLYINRTTTDSVGLFGCTLGGTISNLNLTDLNIQGHYFVGGLVGYNDNTDISKCSSTGTVSGNAAIGGLAGQIINSAVDMCFSTVSVNCSVSYLGGFAAIIDNYTAVSNCYATGSVNGPSSGTARAGGFLGYLNPGGTIDKCYSTGLVTAGTSLVGGFLGGNSHEPGVAVTNSFWDKETSLPTSPAGGIGKTTAEMKTQSTFTDAGWDNTVWNMESGTNNGYPYLDWQYPGGSPLPVNLVNFSATLTEDKVTLEWQTATEINNYGFEIERAVINEQNGAISNQFLKIGFIEGCGNSNSLKLYSYTDENLAKGTYSYRLKQLDNDGNFTYSAEIEVLVNQLPTEFALYQNYPNPFNPSTTISYSIPNNVKSEMSNVKLIVYDILGNEVATLVNELKNAGFYEVSFDGSKLSSGTYFYILQSGNFTETKKLLLLK